MSGFLRSIIGCLLGLALAGCQTTLLRQDQLLASSLSASDGTSPTNWISNIEQAEAEQPLTQEVIATLVPRPAPTPVPSAKTLVRKESSSNPSLPLVQRGDLSSLIAYREASAGLDNDQAIETNPSAAKFTSVRNRDALPDFIVDDAVVTMAAKANLAAATTDLIACQASQKQEDPGRFDVASASSMDLPAMTSDDSVPVSPAPAAAPEPPQQQPSDEVANGLSQEPGVSSDLAPIARDGSATHPPRDAANETIPLYAPEDLASSKNFDLPEQVSQRADAMTAELPGPPALTTDAERSRNDQKILCVLPAATPAAPQPPVIADYLELLSYTEPPPSPPMLPVPAQPSAEWPAPPPEIPIQSADVTRVNEGGVEHALPCGRDGLVADAAELYQDLAIARSDHVIQIGDELEILFPYQAIIGDATSQRLQSPPPRFERVLVRDDGRITAPLLPPILAAGRTPEELREDLIAHYQQFAYDPVAAREAGRTRVYRISVNDTIEVRVRNQPELDDIVLVAPDGRISLQRAGIIVAEGKTIEELQMELAGIYGKVLPETPEVTVTLRDFHSSVVYVDDQPKRIGLRNLDDITVMVRSALRTVYVLGEVRSPRSVTYQGTITLGQALSAAGGHLRTAKMKSIHILRRQTPFSEPETIVIDYRDTLHGKAGQDIPLEHMDVVILNKTPIAVVTDVMEQYIFNIFPFTRNNPTFNLFYDLGGAGIGGGAIIP